jgi:hypothetical protein
MKSCVFIIIFFSIQCLLTHAKCVEPQWLQNEDVVLSRTPTKCFWGRREFTIYAKWALTDSGNYVNYVIIMKCSLTRLFYIFWQSCIFSCLTHIILSRTPTKKYEDVVRCQFENGVLLNMICDNMHLACVLLSRTPTKIFEDVVIFTFPAKWGLTDSGNYVNYA